LPRALNKLTAASLRIRDPGVYADGGGLFLQVTVGADGEPRRSWLCRVTVNGVRRELGLGRADVVTLAEARQKAAELRRTAAQGIDPKEKEQTERAEREAKAATARASVMTFEQCARAYVKAHAPGWRSAKHAAQWSSTLERHANPVFGAVPVGDVTRAMVLQVIEPLWLEKTETAARLRGRIEAVLDWAAVRGLRDGDNPARWRGALQKLLPPRAKVKPVEHRPSMPYGEVGAFLERLRAKPSAAADCLEFAILTACRSGEARGARWGEVDLAAAVWTVPGSRMKGGRPHRVALSSAALDVLERRRRAHGSAPDSLVFESDVRKGAPVSDMTLSAILRRAGLPYVPHGFRSSFRMWCAERTSFPREVAEAALAHVNGDKVEAAYQRSDFFERRRLLMQAWADFLADPAVGEADNVRPIRRAVD
jgi:integrase